MGSLLKTFVKKYTWLFPLILVLIGILYFINLFGRLDLACGRITGLPVFRELEFAIGTMLLITAILNWILVGYAKYIHSGSCPIKKVKTK